MRKYLFVIEVGGADIAWGPHRPAAGLHGGEEMFKEQDHGDQGRRGQPEGPGSSACGEFLQDPTCSHCLVFPN